MANLLKYKKTIVALLMTALGTFAALNVDITPVTGVITDVFCPAPAAVPDPQIEP